MIVHCPNCKRHLGSDIGTSGERAFSKFYDWKCAYCGYEHKAVINGLSCWIVLVVLTAMLFCTWFFAYHTWLFFNG